MNKLMIFLFGTICGYGLSQMLRTPPTVHVAEESSVDSSSRPQTPLVHRSEEVAAPPTPMPTPPPEVAMNTPPHPVYFLFSEETVESMEQNIAALQKDVSVIKDRDGWIVRFHSTDNLLSQVGISDNDLIRFNQLDEMRLNPETQDLANRMESVLANLER